MIDVKDSIRGALIGGAVCDALGFPVVFMTYKQITEKTGTKVLHGIN